MIITYTVATQETRPEGIAALVRKSVFYADKSAKHGLAFTTDLAHFDHINTGYTDSRYSFGHDHCRTLEVIGNDYRAGRLLDVHTPGEQSDL